MEFGFSYDCKWNDNSSMSGTNETFNSFSSFSLASTSTGSTSWASQAGWNPDTPASSSQAGWSPDTPPSSSNSNSGTSGQNDLIDWTDDLVASIDEVLQGAECPSSSTSLVDKYSPTDIKFSPTTSNDIKYNQTEKTYKQAEKPGNRGTLGQFQFQDEHGLEFKAKGRICEEKKVKIHLTKETVNKLHELCSFKK